MAASLVGMVRPSVVACKLVAVVPFRSRLTAAPQVAKQVPTRPRAGCAAAEAAKHHAADDNEEEDKLRSAPEDNEAGQVVEFSAEGFAWEGGDVCRVLDELVSAS